MHTISLRLPAFALALGLLAAGPLDAALAQDSTPPPAEAAASSHRPPDPQKQAQRLAHKLGLDADQQSKLAAILGHRQQQVAAVRSDTTLSMRDRKTKLLAIRRDSESQVRALFSPAQQQQYAQLQQAMKARRQAKLESAPAPASSH